MAGHHGQKVHETKIVGTEEVVWFSTAILVEHMAAGYDIAAESVKLQAAKRVYARLSQRMLRSPWQEAHAAHELHALGALRKAQS